MFFETEERRGVEIKTEEISGECVGHEDLLVSLVGSCVAIWSNGYATILRSGNTNTDRWTDGQTDNPFNQSSAVRFWGMLVSLDMI